VTSIRGPAGSGKTIMMQEAVRAAAALSGKDVFVLASSSSGVEILKHQGFATLDTFQKLMGSASLQDIGHSSGKNRVDRRSWNSLDSTNAVGG
jgi:hypothetical protein